MEGESYLGLYSIRDKSCIDTLPVRNESGMWQAWSMGDGQRYMIQPLDWCREPWEEVRIITKEAFDTQLMPFGDGDSVPASGQAECRSMRSDSPELLSLWYEENAKRNAMNPAYEGPRHTTDTSELTDAPAKARVARDEPVLMPVWHPDAFFDDDELYDRKRPRPTISALDASFPDLFSSGLGEPFFTEDESLYSLPSEAVPGARQQMPEVREPVRIENTQDAGGPENQESEEEKLDRLAAKEESILRASFDLLIGQMGTVPSPELEAELTRIILVDAPFTWKQKFMFTEFGLALRKKKLPRLSLASHKRALAFAPEDEHILFNVARMEYELGNVDAAKEYLSRALKSAPGFVVARNFLNFLEGGTTTKE